MTNRNDNIYVVAPLGEMVNFDDYCRSVKTRFETPGVAARELQWDENALTDTAQFITDEWENIKPFDAEEGFSETSLRRRRLIFSLLDPSEMYPKLKTLSLVDTRQIDNDGLYKLYSYDMSELLKRNLWNSTQYVLQCWCPTTDKEYWICVRDVRNGNNAPDAITAAASTYNVPRTRGDLYRQGDVLLTKMPEDWDNKKVIEYAKNPNNFSPLSKEEYMSGIILEQT